MRIGDLERVTVRDVVLWARVSWGDAKALAKRLQNVSATDPDENARVSEQALLEYVVRVDGLEDADGAPVTKLTPEVLAGLPASWVREAALKLLGGDFDAEQGGGPGNA